MRSNTFTAVAMHRALTRLQHRNLFHVCDTRAIHSQAPGGCCSSLCGLLQRECPPQCLQQLRWYCRGDIVHLEDGHSDEDTVLDHFCKSMSIRCIKWLRSILVMGFGQPSWTN